MQASVSGVAQQQVPDEATAKQIAEYSQVIERLSNAARQFDQPHNKVVASWGDFRS